MTGTDVIIAVASGVMATAAWLHGYGRGVEAFRRRAVKSLHTSADLRRALSTDEQILRTADAFDNAALRIELLPHKDVR